MLPFVGGDILVTQKNVRLRAFKCGSRMVKLAHIVASALMKKKSKSITSPKLADWIKCGST